MPLLQLLKDPQHFPALSPDLQELALRNARRTYLLSTLGQRIEDCNAKQALPRNIQQQLFAAQILASQHRQRISWETEQIRIALAAAGLVPILLKGAAYLFTNPNVARGRLASDVDILVAEADLDTAEAALREAGWVEAEIDDYDQRYYREWMHELPPFHHPLRGVVVDLHHNILPRTARSKPRASLLTGAAVPVADGQLRVLTPVDTVLHKVAHLFFSGEFDNPLRELVDLDGLLRDNGELPGFWDSLVPRASELELARPLFYGIRYTRLLLSTQVPDTVVAELGALGAPNRFMLWVMDRLIPPTLVPTNPDEVNPAVALRRKLLYLRAHWLRMPPLLLARHFLRKTFKRASIEPAPERSAGEG